MFACPGYPSKSVTTSRMVVAGVVVFAATNVSLVMGQPSGKAIQRRGEVTGNNVYVRSGPSTNHYPVCKLSAGDPVMVVGERGEWYEIESPRGTFSLISGGYVDTEDHQRGVVNGDNVRVRAGSQLNDSMYTVQTMLSKGSEVTILGKNANGFLRIKSPVGTTLWISRPFVALFGEDSPQRSVPSNDEVGFPATASKTGGVPAGGDESAGGALENESSASSPLDGVELSSEKRRVLQAVEGLLGEELAKPLLQRNVEEIVKRLRPIAEQNEDEFAQRYAQARLAQIDDMVSVVQTVRKIRELDEKAQAKRREYLDARSKLHPLSPPAPAALDAQGELRESALYPPGSVPRRFRLVDPDSPDTRTLGYLEIAPGSPVNIDRFLGRYVGVRASARRLQQGAVDPVPIYIVSELVLLNPPETKPVGDAQG